MQRLIVVAVVLAGSVVGYVQAFEPAAPATSSTAAPLVPVVTEVRSGSCISVTDGDTIKVKTEAGVIPVRLEGIDAPESRQAHSAKATTALRELVKGKDVEVHVTGADRYGRTLAIVKVGTLNVNEQLLVDGWAWQYDEYNTDPAWAALEAEARSQKRGLWAHENNVAPWEYRKLERKRRQITQDRRDRERDVPIDAEPEEKELKFWLNTSSNVRHNDTCEHYEKTKRGRACTKSEGKPCGICGG